MCNQFPNAQQWQYILPSCPPKSFCKIQLLCFTNQSSDLFQWQVEANQLLNTCFSLVVRWMVRWWDGELISHQSQNSIQVSSFILTSWLVITQKRSDIIRNICNNLFETHQNSNSWIVFVALLFVFSCCCVVPLLLEKTRDPGWVSIGFHWPPH